MEVEQRETLSQYRQHLLDSLRTLSHRQREGRPGRLQIFVNRECVGDFDCGTIEPQFGFASRERTIDLVELRAEDGTLIGGLSAPDLGLRSARVQWAGHDIDVAVHNRADGGSLRMAAKAAPALWETLVRKASAFVPSWSGGGWSPAALHGMAVVQVAIFAAVVFLIGDRVYERMERADLSATVATAVGQELASGADTREAVSRLEETVSSLLTAQAASSQLVAGQQKAVTAVQRVVEELAQQQKQLGTQVVSVQQMEEHQERIARQSNLEVERMTKVLMGQVQTDRAQLRDELHSLSMANEHLAKHVSSMEKKNQELAGRLRAAGIDVSSRVKEGSDSPVQVAREKGATEATSPQVADARPEASPLKFFVSFQDGTTEESIDRWFQELHAQKGDADSGWYSVEVPRPPQQPADRFMEGLKSVKIVKAVVTSRTRLSAR